MMQKLLQVSLGLCTLFSISLYSMELVQQTHKAHIDNISKILRARDETDVIPTTGLYGYKIIRQPVTIPVLPEFSNTHIYYTLNSLCNTCEILLSSDDTDGNGICFVKCRGYSKKGSTLCIENVKTNEQFKRKKLATLLMQEIIQLSKQAGYKKIILESLVYCQSLYTKLGFQVVKNNESKKHTAFEKTLIPMALKL